MQRPWLRVIADDLTGACDVGAALAPHPGPIVVEWLERAEDAGTPTPESALVVRNTQSRTLPPAQAAERVRRALAGVPQGRPGVLLKKIDTALRGALGAEIDAAMDAVGADLALVLAAIPEAGRTTVDGQQLIDGVPVDRTPFANDPQNPVRDARIARVVAATSRRHVASVGLPEMRSVGAARALARCRAAGHAIVVGDVASDADLDQWVAGLAGERGPGALVLAGSTGLAKAWRRAVPVQGAAPGPAVRQRSGAATGVLVVAGSAHPATRAQLAHAEGTGWLAVVAVALDDPAESGREAAAWLRRGRDACLAAPGDVREASELVLDAVAAATATALAEVCPSGLVLVGGETAFAALGRVGHPRLVIEGEPAPLAVRAVVADGPLAGVPVVTKGGSSGPPERLLALVREVGR